MVIGGKLEAWKLVRIGLVALFAAFALIPSAQASCGNAFNGIWEFTARQGNQRTAGTFIQGRTVFLGSKTYLYEYIPSLRMETEKRIVDLEWRLGDNLSVKRINKNTCEIRLRNPHVYKDTYSAVGKRRQGRVARLTVSGNKFTMCWPHADQDFGQCQTYRKSR